MKIGVLKVTPIFITDLFYIKYNLTLNKTELLKECNSEKTKSLLDFLIFNDNENIRISNICFDENNYVFIITVFGVNLPIENDKDEITITYEKNKYGNISYKIGGKK